MTNKRTVPQAVFDSPSALKIQKAGHSQAVAELNATPRRLLDPANPNHPDRDRIFGYDQDEFLARQFK